ncbi:putative spermidine/putrescine transport system ATP-binding protein [Rhizobiales bacterium GAS191]|nr:putative spermidine/putrescine transport system ATP-binding protein [Rhizobiales bacterium GAS191]
MTHLQLDGLTRTYGTITVVNSVSLAIEKGCFLALLGPSGCGKTTTLRMIAGLEKPDAGRVLVGGQDITSLPPHRRGLGVVFQSYALFPHMSVLANIGFGLEMQGVGKSERRQRAAAALEMVGLSTHAQMRTRQLSGGQQQRVALARALAIEPQVLLLDEPLSALDAKLREELRTEMRLIQRRAGTTSVFVTHDQAEAQAMADLVAVMNAGRIEQLDTPVAIFERPASIFVARFVGRSACFKAQMRDGVAQVRGIVLRGDNLPSGGDAEIFVRPHRIRLLAPGASEDNVLRGVIAALDYTGEVMQVIVETDAGRVPVDVGTFDDGWRSLQPGQSVRLGWKAADTLGFPV